MHYVCIKISKIFWRTMQISGSATACKWRQWESNRNLKVTSRHQPPTPVFFNFFAAVEPYTSVKVTHGTPCALIRESSDVGYARLKLWTHFPSKAETPWRRQSRQRRPIIIWHLTAFVGSSRHYVVKKSSWQPWQKLISLSYGADKLLSFWLASLL